MHQIARHTGGDCTQFIRAAFFVDVTGREQLVDAWQFQTGLCRCCQRANSTHRLIGLMPRRLAPDQRVLEVDQVILTSGCESSQFKPFATAGK